MAGIFKAYDIRGVYPDQLNEDVAYRIGFHFKAILDADDMARGGTVVVSRDMRDSSIPLTAALTQGLRSAGLHVIDIGLATTPMNYFAVGHLGASAGIQVTASHNPSQYNGFKMSRRDAIPVSMDSGIAIVEQLVDRQAAPEPHPTGSLSSREVTGAYSQHVLSFQKYREPRLKVAVDAANGMGTLYLDVLEALNIELFPLYFQLDGNFPNHEANPLKVENLRDLQQSVREFGCDLGVAFDGDADRAILVDDASHPVSADLITALLAGPILERFPGSPIVYDIRSSWATREAVQAAGGVPVRERVGHSFMKATMRKLNSPFGGELAGHFYYRENFFADSSLITVVEMLNLIRRNRVSLSSLLAPLKRYASTGEINFHVDDKAGMMSRLEQEFPQVKADYTDGITLEFEDWWFNVRPSNTEPLLRLVLEARTPEILDWARARLLSILGEPESGGH